MHDITVGLFIDITVGLFIDITVGLFFDITVGLFFDGRSDTSCCFLYCQGR